MDNNWHWWCHNKWRFQKILSNFELVMNLGSFGQTMVDQSLWIVYFRFVQMVYHYKKSCLPGRTWSSAVVDGDHPARIFGPPWPIRKLFFSFSRPSTATDWAKTWPMVVRPVVDDDFSLPAAKSTQICALTSMGPKCQRHWRSFFFSVAHLFELPRSSRLWFSIMGPRRQPHKTRKHWILGFFFTPDFWLLDSNFDPCPLVKRWGRLQAHGSQMSASQN